MQACLCNPSLHTEARLLAYRVGFAGRSAQQQDLLKQMVTASSGTLITW